jgi:hypothetical protein
VAATRLRVHVGGSNSAGTISSIKQSQSIGCARDNTFVCPGYKNSTISTFANGEAAAPMLLAEQVERLLVVNLDVSDTNSCVNSVFVGR